MHKLISLFALLALYYNVGLSLHPLYRTAPLRSIYDDGVLIESEPLTKHSVGSNVAILRQQHNINPDGSYHYSYDTEKGVSALEQLDSDQVDRSYAYTLPGNRRLYSYPSYLPEEYNEYRHQPHYVPTTSSVYHPFSREIWN